MIESNEKERLRNAVLGKLLYGGAIGAAIFIGVMMFWAVPYWMGRVVPVETVQTGPNGISMGSVAFEHDLEALALANVMPESEEPYVPEGGEELAGDIYENVQILGHLTDDNFNRVMAAITEWVAPEKGCAYCHGDEGDFASDDYYAKVVSRTMIQMTWNINENWGDHVQDTGVTCYTCHRGNNVPEYVWNSPAPLSTKVGDNAAYQNRAMEANLFSSLPLDALQAYLGDYEPISVQSATALEANEGTASIQDTERTYNFMMHFADSLGVNCTHCHNSRAWGSWEQSTPQRTIAQLGIAMVQEANSDYVDALADVLPEHRLGPLGDAPKVNCKTCHQGAPKPLLGQSMIGDWPELAAEEAVYN